MISDAFMAFVMAGTETEKWHTWCRGAACLDQILILQLPCDSLATVATVFRTKLCAWIHMNHFSGQVITDLIIHHSI